MTSNEFKPGELIFLIDRVNNVRLVKYVTNFGSKTVEARDTETDNDYLGYGFAATPENREALVTLYSEDEVPKLPLQGNELCKAMLDRGDKYVLCIVADEYEELTNSSKTVRVIYSRGSDYFEDTAYDMWYFATPIDMNGNEITEYEK